MLTGLLTDPRAAGARSGRRDQKFWKARLPLFSVLAAVFAFTMIAAGSYYSIDRLEARASWVDHSHEVLSRLDDLFVLAKDAQSNARIYVISGDPKLSALFNLYRDNLPRHMTSLRTLISDNPYQEANLDALEAIINQYLVVLKHAVQLRDSHQESAALSLISSDEALRLIGQIRTHIGMMENEEKRLLSERSLAVERSTTETKLLIVFGTIGAYSMMAAAFMVLRREMRQRQAADNALHETNEELQRHARQLETTNKELESFSYSISHDLRIPLRAVSGYASMMEEDFADKVGSEGQRFLKVIRDNSKRMGELIDDLLAFSRLGRREIAAAEVDMTMLATSALDEVRRRGEYPNVKVTIDSLPPAWGDRGLLQQVWINLVSNALKYSATQNEPTIRINGATEGSEAIYRVSDNGVGFDMQYYDKLFGVFQRLHSIDEFPGTGVGLAIVQRIVVRHGGRVWAHSELGHGATFSFSLPLKRSIDG